jgi:translation initiation factor 2 alpha subunit (eIF-2alpha)
MNPIIAAAVALAFAAILLLQWRKAEIGRRAEAARSALLARLTERFGDSEEFLAFARSAEGRLLLGARDPAAETAKRLLLIAQSAALLAALGIAFIVTVMTTPAGADINLVRAAEEALYWGTMCLALAAGLAFAFWFGERRARSWGLLPR